MAITDELMDERFKDGYGIVFRSVMRDTNLTIGAKAVYSYLCTFAGNKKTAFPSRKLMCHELGISGDTLTKYMKNLIDTGYIRKDQEKIEGKFAHNIYTICDIHEKLSQENTDSENFRHVKFPTRKISDINNNSIYNNNIDLNNTYIVDSEKNKKQEQIPYKEIIEYLNEKAGKQYRDTTPKTRELIRARWNEGFGLEDFKRVIDNKTLLWKNTEMETYLRPVTLFSTKFESYLNEDPNIIKRQKPKMRYDPKEYFNDRQIDALLTVFETDYKLEKFFNNFAEKYDVEKQEDTKQLLTDFYEWYNKIRSHKRNMEV